VLRVRVAGDTANRCRADVVEPEVHVAAKVPARIERPRGPGERGDLTFDVPGDSRRQRGA
jgi:hypothetical protein